MRIQWTTDVELQIMENEDVSYNEVVKTGEIDEIDIVGGNEQSVDIQFGNGDVAYSVNRSYFVTIDE